MEKNKTVSGLKKQLAAAIAMVLVAAISLGTSTYAWFAVNSKVTATGMNFTATVRNNLFITDDTLDSTAKKADSDFTTALVQDVSGLLQPVSTVNGKDFFYSKTDNVKGDGDTKTDSWIAYNAANTADFNTNYGTTGAVGYIDYVFQLKAVNGTGSDLKIKLTDLGLSFNATSDPQKTFRVAVFAQNITDTNPTANELGDLKAIYTVDGAGNFTTNEAVTSTTALDRVTYNQSFELNAGRNKSTYYKVVVRLWLEGEDNTCNNTTFADLNNGKWALSCEWKLDSNSSETAVTKITETLTTTPVDLTSATVGPETVEINGVTYYKITGVTIDTNTALYANSNPITKDSKIYTIGANLYPIEVTNRCTLPTT